PRDPFSCAPVVGNHSIITAHTILYKPGTRRPREGRMRMSFSSPGVEIVSLYAVQCEIESVVCAHFRSHPSTIGSGFKHCFSHFARGEESYVGLLLALLAKSN